MNRELWKKLKLYIKRSDLIYIANADYGYDSEKHYEALLDIYENNKMPLELKWEPHEVISLSKWPKYSKENKKQILIVFFCAFLLLEAVKSDKNLDYLDGFNQDIILAIDCAYLLGSDWLELVNEYLQDLYDKVNKPRLEEEIIYFSLGISILGLLLNNHTAFIKWAGQTTKDIETVEAGGFYNKNNSLLGYTFFDGNNNIWQKYLDKYRHQIKHSPINKVLTRVSN